MIDKRQVDRFNLKLSGYLRVSASGGELQTFSLVTRDISSSGAFFLTNQPLPVGTEVKVELILPIKNSENEKKLKESLIKASGPVVRKDKDGMAVGFEKTASLRPFVQDKSEASQAPSGSAGVRSVKMAYRRIN